MSQERLAQLASLGRTYVSGIERGERNPKPGELELSEHVFGRDGPVPVPPALEEQLRQCRGMRLPCVPLRSSARRDLFARRLAEAQRDKCPPGDTTATRTERGVGSGDLARELVRLLPAAKRTERAAPSRVGGARRPRRRATGGSVRERSLTYRRRRLRHHASVHRRAVRNAWSQYDSSGSYQRDRRPRRLV